MFLSKYQYLPNLLCLYGEIMHNSFHIMDLPGSKIQDGISQKGAIGRYSLHITKQINKINFEEADKQFVN